MQRQSPNARPAFTDEEVLTVYLFALMYSHHTVKAIYDYVQAHFADWFPEMPSYAGYVYRLNRLHAVYAPLLEAALEEDGLEEDGLKRVARLPTNSC